MSMLPHWEALVVGLAGGALSGTVAAYITATISSKTQLSLQREQIEADRKAELRRNRQHYAVRAQAAFILIASYLTQPDSFRTIFSGRPGFTISRFLELVHNMTKDVTGLMLVLPKDLAIQLRDFSRGPLKEFVELAEQVGSRYAEFTPQQAAEATSLLREKYYQLLDAYAPIEDQIRSLIIET